MLFTLLVVAVVVYYFVVRNEPMTWRQVVALTALLMVNGLLSIVNLFVS